jgi:hypothetical protein
LSSASSSLQNIYAWCLLLPYRKNTHTISVCIDTISGHGPRAPLTPLHAQKNTARRHLSRHHPIVTP